MKKLLIALSVILTTTLAGCITNPDAILPVEGLQETSKCQVVIIDSCEYLRWDYGLSHKGNCKYCAERRRKEYEALMEDIIIELYW